MGYRNGIAVSCFGIIGQVCPEFLGIGAVQLGEGQHLRGLVLTVSEDNVSMLRARCPLVSDKGREVSGIIVSFSIGDHLIPYRLAKSRVRHPRFGEIVPEEPSRPMGRENSSETTLVFTLGRIQQIPRIFVRAFEFRKPPLPLFRGGKEGIAAGMDLSGLFGVQGC